MPAEVIVEDAERANLLELMLASFLRRRLAAPRARAHAMALAAPVEIRAGAMQATLLFSGGDVFVSRDRRECTEAHVHGSLGAVIDAALGRRRLEHLLRRELQVGGSPRVLWHLLALLRVPGPR